MNLYLKLKNSNNKAIHCIRYLLNTKYKDIQKDKYERGVLRKLVADAKRDMDLAYDNIIITDYNNFNRGFYTNVIPSNVLALLRKHPEKLAMSEITCITKQEIVDRDAGKVDIDGDIHFSGTRMKMCKYFAEYDICKNEKCWCFDLNRQYSYAKKKYDTLKMKYDNFWTNKFDRVK